MGNVIKVSSKSFLNPEWIKDTSKFNADCTESYNEESEEEYFLKVDVQYTEILHEFHNDLPFLPERTKIEKVKKHITNLNHKTGYAIHKRNLKQALHHELF